jgi:hypothetical protein
MPATIAGGGWAAALCPAVEAPCAQDAKGEIEKIVSSKIVFNGMARLQTQQLLERNKLSAETLMGVTEWCQAKPQRPSHNRWNRTASSIPASPQEMTGL